MKNATIVCYIAQLIYTTSGIMIAILGFVDNNIDWKDPNTVHRYD